MELTAEYLLFLAKSVTVLLVLLALMYGSARLRKLRGKEAPGWLQAQHLNKRYKAMADTLAAATGQTGELRRAVRWWRRDKSHRAAETQPRQRVFVLDFKGDIRASAVSSLREEVTAILITAKADDEVLLRLESGGGLVNAYGLAASQVQRIKQRGLKLTIAVDRIAASGGYMMACVADQLLAAPFAVVGSIGVIAQTPNFHRLLKKHDIDFEQFMAGESKRTVTLFGENTDADRQKFREQIEETHQLFKNFVAGQRPHLDLAKVATGEFWYGSQALDLKLVDELRTSDDYLLAASESRDLYRISYLRRRTFLESLFSLREDAP